MWVYIWYLCNIKTLKLSGELISFFFCFRWVIFAFNVYAIMYMCMYAFFLFFRLKNLSYFYRSNVTVKSVLSCCEIDVETSKCLRLFSERNRISTENRSEDENFPQRAYIKLFNVLFNFACVYILCYFYICVMYNLKYYRALL